MFLRAFASALLSLCLLAPVMAAAAPPININSPKYAGFVMDADTGEVFYERNASKRRYPASLTKMMTLYMLFDALKRESITLDTRMPVSERAASQPQTNISLKAGQTISVGDAIKALVVRSANDVAVVIAEQLGNTEWNFAVKMTQTARSLGMNQTQFRNAHGLPDRQQYTSARDMSKLAIALRRDFPQYYTYFTTQSFTWKGRTYTSHNRVLKQFDGVDGIKTGYINMSGFNLASSVKRDGYHIVAVVLGGQTSRSRDAHMVSLLERTFAQIEERGDEPRLFATAPVPTPKPGSLQVASAKTGLPWIKVSLKSSPDEQKETSTSEVLKFAKADTEQEPERGLTNKPEAKEEPKESFIRFVAAPEKPSVAPTKPNSLNFQLASLSPSGMKEKWGIQVGAFRDEKAALVAAAKAVKMARSELKFSKINITDQGQAAASIHRAQLANLTETQARRACQRLSQSATPCFVFKLDQQNL